MNPFDAPAARRWRWRTGIAAAVLAASSAAALSSAAAQASAAPRPHATARVLAKTVVPLGGPAVIRLTADRAPAAILKPAQPVILCYLQVNDPHKSRHITTTINVVATVECDETVSALSIAVRLYRVSNGNEYEVANGGNSNRGNSFIQANAATNCSSGTYTADANGTITSPPGFNPPGTNPIGPTFSHYVNITC